MMVVLCIWLGGPAVFLEACMRAPLLDDPTHAPAHPPNGGCGARTGG